jgi:thiamine kinase
MGVAHLVAALSQAGRQRVIASEVLAQVPGCENGRPPDAITRLNAASRTRSVWQLQTRAGQFVVHQQLPNPDEKSSSAAWELTAHRFAAAAGIAPPVLAAAVDGSWMLTRYLPDPSWVESYLQTDLGIDALGSILVQLHQRAVPVDWPAMDATQIALNYAGQLRAGKFATDSSKDIDPLLTRIRQLSAEIAQGTDRRCLNHGDLVVSNMLGPWLIDWEFAQVAHPTYDIACLLVYYPQLEAQKSRLLAATALDSPHDHALLTLQCECFAGLNQLWSAVNGRDTG